MEPCSPLVIFGIACVSLVRVCTGQMVLPKEDLHTALTVRPELAERSEAMCSELRKEPYFEPEMVVLFLWKVVYMWNMDLGSKCIDIKFKLATPMIIKRFYFDMHEYLDDQPAWGAASLLLKLGQMEREILLFDDGLAGKFLAVPNVLRDAVHPPMRHAVPLMKFQMKLTRDGKYLIFMDCMVGLTALAARVKPALNRTEISAVVETLGDSLGDGYHACLPQTEGPIISQNLDSSNK
ncbi:hypothetical protein NE865_11765 [Phthorimaea operculella]|nr:hypothetical protein NE865_11765 [Phthorimaea operculella]